MYDLNTIVAMNAKAPSVGQEEVVETIVVAAMCELVRRIETGQADNTDREVAKLLAAWLAKRGADNSAPAPAVSGHATRGGTDFYAWNR